MRLPKSFCAASLAVCCLGVQPGAAQIFTPVTEGTGPAMRVVEYRLAPGAGTFRLDADSVEDVVAAIRAEDEAAARQEGIDIALQVYGDWQSGLQAGSAVAEHTLALSRLSGVTKGLTYAGVVFTALQVGNDWSQGRDTAAATGAYKGAIEFAIGIYGWPALQAAGASLFLFDLTLRQWQSGLRESYLDRWRPGFRRAFREDPALRRSVNDWSRIVWDLYLQAERVSAGNRNPDMNRFRDLVEAEVASYAALGDLERVAFYTDLDQTGGGSSGLNDEIIAALADEYRESLLAMLTLDVLPPIAVRAHTRQVRRMLEWTNEHHVPERNRTFRLEVTAWGGGDGQVRIPLPAGGEWGGPLGPDGTFTLDITLFAYIRAGLPELIVLDGPDGRQEAPLLLRGDRAVAIFGQPQAQYVARNTLDEGPRFCMRHQYTVDRIHIESERFTDAERAPVTFDTAVMPGGLMVAGHYDDAAGRWAQAAPGVVRHGYQLHFGPPLVDGLSIMENCTVSLFSPEGQVASGQCRFVRQTERFEDGRIIMDRCESDGRVTLTGIFADMGQGMQYWPMEGATGRMIADIIRQSVREGVVNMTPDMLQGLTGTIPGLPPMPQMPGGN